MKVLPIVLYAGGYRLLILLGVTLTAFHILAKIYPSGLPHFAPPYVNIWLTVGLTNRSTEPSYLVRKLLLRSKVGSL